MTTRPIAALLLALGLGLSYYAWHTAASTEGYSLKAAVMGPLLAVFGGGLLVHGDVMFARRTALLLRIYGVSGSVCAALNVYLLGLLHNDDSVERMLEIGIPALLLVAWLVPKRRARPPD
jgi:hypothetical protein